eukprot:scaffold76561_cov62-Phaeocystis_antarctica.AAC.12
MPQAARQRAAVAGRARAVDHAQPATHPPRRLLARRSLAAHQWRLLLPDLRATAQAAARRGAAAGARRLRGVSAVEPAARRARLPPEELVPQLGRHAAAASRPAPRLQEHRGILARGGPQPGLRAALAGAGRGIRVARPRGAERQMGGGAGLTDGRR